MENGRFTLHRRALPAFDVLTPAERESLRGKLARLADSPPERWVDQGATRISPDEPLYMIRIDDSLRVLLRGGEEGRPEILDIVRHETLQWFRSAAGDAAHA